MSAPEVKALLDGSTQARRLVKPIPPNGLIRPAFYNGHGWRWTRDKDNSAWPGPSKRQAVNWLACPYGVAGGRIWVKETFALHDDRKPPIVYYRADDSTKYDSDGKWTPSIHMPRWASRITLEITGVRVERLQDISEEDAMAEGVCQPMEGPWPATMYSILWDSLHGKGAWERNDWVWVLQFKRT